MTEPHDSNSTQQLHASSATSTGKRMGVLTAYYNFVADYRVLGEKVAARQIPCGCAQCVQKGGKSMTGGAHSERK